MSVLRFERPRRTPATPPPHGDIVLESPPDQPETVGGSGGQLLTYLPMAAGAGAMVFMFTGNGATTTTYLASGMYALSTVGTMVGQVTRGVYGSRQRADGDRRDYLRYLRQVRRQAQRVAQQQRDATWWEHPDPDALWSLAMTGRLWERRPEHADFGHVRFAVGVQALATALIAPETKPVDDLEPVTATALRRFMRAHATVPDLPIAVSLTTTPRIELTGDAGAARALARAILAQAVTFHGPDELRVMLCASDEHLTGWDWLKWLPHMAHPALSDGAGPVRFVASDLATLEAMAGPDLGDRPRFHADPGRAPSMLPHLVVVLDGGRVGAEAQLAAADVHGVTLLRIGEASGRAGTPATLRLHVERGRVARLHVDAAGQRSETPLGRPDLLAEPAAAALARQLSPVRLSGAVHDEPQVRELSLAGLLGLGDVAALDADEAWRPRAPRERLRATIGLTAEGTPLELDLKESAQGGMGPHGLVVGATGSGKSELLRTLVSALAVTHPPDVLNFVLVDFKGGATFFGLDRLPHVSAVITNLADDLHLVERMHDALSGEIVRRQEVLRRSGNHTSVREYEQARAAGAALPPLPSLVVVVDEFTELLLTKPEFADLFVMIGRLGRSLGVHLLLATQRLEEGRLRGLETHLSYRIGLRMFSGAESRAVLGTQAAYELPLEPGHAYLRADVSTLVRFRSAYVSGPYRSTQAPHTESAVGHQVVPFTARPVPGAPAVTTAPTEDAADIRSEGPRVFDLLVDRLAGHGTPAHQVWLPPLDASPTLGELATTSLPGRLHVAVGVVDRPLEQTRSRLTADLAGAAGHVGIVGGPQSGKSNLMRVLACALALRHTPVEIQLYGLDFGGGALAAIAQLPHVGGVAGRTDPEKVRRIIAELTALLETRERRFADLGVESIADYLDRRGAPDGPDPFGHVFLLVDGWGTLRADFESLEPDIVRLAARGLAYGLHVVLTANRWVDIRPVVRDLLGTRFELRLGDPFDSDVDRRAAALVPAGVPGRGLTAGRLHFLTALPRFDGHSRVTDLGDGVAGLVASVRADWSGPDAPAVRLLPTELSPAAFADAVAGATGAPVADAAAKVTPQQDAAASLNVPLGIAETDLSPVVVDFDHDPHFLIFGERGAGKSTALRHVARQIARTHAPEQARLIVVDYRRGLLDAVSAPHLIGYAGSASQAAPLVNEVATAMHGRMPGPDVSPAQLKARSWWTGADLFLVVDDYELVATPAGNPLTPLLELLPQARDIGLHLVVARSTGGASRGLFEPVMQRLRDLTTPGLIMSGSREEGALLGNVAAARMPAGRGQLVDRRRPNTVLQVPHETA